MSAKSIMPHHDRIITDLQQQLKTCEDRISILEESNADLLRKCKRLDTILEALPYPFYIVKASDYTISLANKAALKEMRADEHLTCHEINHKRRVPCDSNENTCPLELVKKTERPAAVEHIHRNSAGSPQYVQVHGYPIFNENGEVVEMIEYSIDITEQKKAEQKLIHMANHDSLTDLPNRNLFLERLNLEIQHAKRERKKVAVLLIDLDDFKEINDTLGHTAGDRLLIKVGKILANLLRKSDTVARMGGDEFLLLLPDLASEDYIHSLSQKILNSLQQPFRLEGQKRSVKASIGGTVYPDDSDNPESLIKFADIAMYRAKRRRGSSFQLYQGTDGHRHDYR